MKNGNSSASILAVSAVKTHVGQRKTTLEVGKKRRTGAYKNVAVPWYLHYDQQRLPSQNISVFVKRRATTAKTIQIIATGHQKTTAYGTKQSKFCSFYNFLQCFRKSVHFGNTIEHALFIPLKIQILKK